MRPSAEVLAPVSSLFATGNVPRLQIIRNRSRAVKSFVQRTFLPVLTSSSICRRVSSNTWSYTSLSLVDRRRGTNCSRLAGRERQDSVLRRQQASMYARSGLESGVASARGVNMYFWKVSFDEIGYIRRNWASEARSSSLFWMGVPDRHHLLLLVRLAAALNCFDDELRIQ